MDEFETQKGINKQTLKYNHCLTYIILKHKANTELSINANEKYSGNNSNQNNNIQEPWNCWVFYKSLSFPNSFIFLKTWKLCFAYDKPTYSGLFHKSVHMNSKQLNTGRTHPSVSDASFLLNEWRSKYLKERPMLCIEAESGRNKHEVPLSRFIPALLSIMNTFYTTITLFMLSTSSEHLLCPRY